MLDNSSTHNTEDVRAWRPAHPRVQFHYTPTSASWLNLIEGFFGILAKQSLSLTDFASRQALQASVTRRVLDAAISRLFCASPIFPDTPVEQWFLSTACT